MYSLNPKMYILKIKSEIKNVQLFVKSIKKILPPYEILHQYQYPLLPRHGHCFALSSPLLSPTPSCHTLPHISPRKMSSSKPNFFSLQVIFSRKLVNTSISKADPSPLLTSPSGPNSWIESPFGILLVTTLFNFGQESLSTACGK